ncbi:MAG: CinA family protein, partial [Clostridia bacterium]|nr:CinA family protein [Clostridia bacterium]
LAPSDFLCAGGGTGTAFGSEQTRTAGYWRLGRDADGGVDGTPAGTVFIAVAGPGGTTVEACHFNGSRDFVRTVAASWALNALRLRMEALS